MATREDTAAERLNKHSIPEPNSGCLLWMLASNRQGYGVTSYNGRQYLAHRLSYEVAFESPGKMCVLHRCDTPACIRPSHLFLGTRRDNLEDMTEKGRRKGNPWSLRLSDHCSAGHEYTQANTILLNNGRRNCRTCRVARSRRGYLAKIARTK